MRPRRSRSRGAADVAPRRASRAPPSRRTPPPAAWRRRRGGSTETVTTTPTIARIVSSPGSLAWTTRRASRSEARPRGPNQAMKARALREMAALAQHDRHGRGPGDEQRDRRQGERRGERHGPDQRREHGAEEDEGEEHDHLGGGVAVLEEAVAELDVEGRDRRSRRERGEEPVSPDEHRPRVRGEDEAHAVERLVLPADAELAGPCATSARRPAAPIAEADRRPEDEQLAEEQRPAAEASRPGPSRRRSSTRTTGSTTTSFVAASVVSDWRTAPGIRLSRTMSRTTTGSVEDRIAPMSIADATPRPEEKVRRGRDEQERQERPGPENERRHEPLARASGRTSSARRRGRARGPA